MEFIIIAILLIMVVIGCASWLMVIVLKPYLERKNDIREKQVKNDLYRLYTEIDPDIIHKNINNLIDNKISEYMLVNIRTRESQYMNSQDIDNMIREVSADLYMNLSDMYITFIKMIYSVETDDDLIVYLNKTVKMRSIQVVSENNKLI